MEWSIADAVVGALERRIENNGAETRALGTLATIKCWCGVELKAARAPRAMQIIAGLSTVACTLIEWGRRQGQFC